MIVVSHHIGNEKFFQNYLHVFTEQQKVLELSPAIGLNSLTSVHGTDFGITDTLYFFQALRKFFNWKDLLKISATGTAKYSAKIFKILTNGW
jgi:purine-nucleoside phosphorylase